ncbi:hypothetical protein BDY24DRAFT_419180 [Mrakia frigida]|uniref:uncharacterized protein n=1 Tax=Mrakia frigida TaxID=29902 RepID=UPI003FCC006B
MAYIEAMEQLRTELDEAAAERETRRPFEELSATSDQKNPSTSLKPSFPPSTPSRRSTTPHHQLSPSSSASSLPPYNKDHTPITPSGPLSSLHAVQTEAKVLYREVPMFLPSPMVVNLSGLGLKTAGAGTGAGTGKWTRRSKRPEAIVEERRREGEMLEGLVKGLNERAARPRMEEERRRW